MTTVYDVPADTLIRKLAEKLKEMESFNPPYWTKFVKTGVQEERSPEQFDWWYVRVASIFRGIYTDGPVGIERLRTVYGGRKRRRAKPPRFRKGSGAVIRNALHQLEKAGFVTKVKDGRIVTPHGRAFLDRTAKEVMEGLVHQMPALAKY
jgi:small subunit ribosomal protein S19e